MSTITLNDVIHSIRNVPDFPKPGILFKDITTALKKPEIYQYIFEKTYEYYKDKKITKVVGIESRGFILGGALAAKLNAGFVPIRKPNKLPAPVFSRSYSLEYGENILNIHQDALDKDDIILLHDDVLATGGSAKAALELIRMFPVNRIYVNFICELTFLNGKSQIENDIDTFSLISF
jgi:adenine phosphoribosyltransferase